MERARKARTPLRANLTKVVNELEVEIAKDPVDREKILMLENRLEEHRSRLSVADEKIVELLLDDDADDATLQAEHDGAEEYHQKAETILIKILRIKNPPHQHSPTASVHADEAKKRNYKLPKIELQKFDGELKNWLEWWSHFKKIDEDDELHISDKYHYLVQSMEEGSKAQRLVKAYPKSEENYPKAVTALKERFGKPELLIEMYVRELQKVIMTTAKSKEKPALSVTYDSLETQLRSLESLGVSPDQMTLFLLPFVESCLPEDTLVAWQRSSIYEQDGATMNPPKSKLDLLMEFLRREVEGEEKRKLARSGFEEPKMDKGQHIKKSKSSGESLPTVASLFNGQHIGEVACIFCMKKNHKSLDCFKAKRMTVEEKVKKLKGANACLNCFKKGHHAKTCRLINRCSSCNQKHHLVMCPSNSNKELSGVTEAFGKISVAESTTTNTNGSGKVGQVLLKTLRVRVKGVNGNEMLVRLLFDEGSQRSYIKSSLAEQLSFPVIEKFKEQNNLFGGHKTEELAKKIYKVKVQGIDKTESRDLSLINEDVICTTCPTIPQGKWIKELQQQQIRLTDIGTGSEEIHILIGSDLRDQLMTGRMFKLKCGLFAVEWIFGWTLSGPIPKAPTASYAAITINMLTCEERSLPKLWNLETIGIKDSAEKLSLEEHEYKVKKSVQDTLTRDQNGRYVVCLPWIAESTFPPSNRNAAERRLVSATEKLNRQSQYQNYEQVFMDWEEEGIIEKCTISEIQEHFLPHRPVFKPESKTTPVRPVFDGSCKVGKNPSLNQCLEKGPNMLELIPSILLRFRQKNIGVVSDIRKAFLMVGVAEEDRNMQKFLWWEKRKNSTETLNLVPYRHCRVVFGLNCSPFLLAAVLEHHLSNVKLEDKAVAEILKKSLYVDNCVVSVDSAAEYHEFKKRATLLLANAKMELRGWESSLDEEQTEQTSSVLGLVWDRRRDLLSIQMPKFQPELVVTKRNVLSVASQVFDPIGFTCPAMLQAKLLLQESWTADLGWDTEWDDERSLKFKKWYVELKELISIQIPRKGMGAKAQGNFQIHTFCDASKGAYSAVVFGRMQEQNNVEVQLLAAKSRLAPLDKKKKKSITINRLELLGCVIGARLAKSVLDALNLENSKLFYWSDSSSALSWIKREENWGTFVGNRTQEINSISKKENWYHVPGTDNPADLPSRGCSPSQLVQSRWWEGPAWLKLDESCWPKEVMIVEEDEVNQEKKKSNSAVMLNTAAKFEPRFSSYIKNIRVAAYIRRFLYNCKAAPNSRIKTHFFTIDELRKAEKDILQQVQSRHYATAPTIKNLDVKLQQDGLWHIKTRLLYKDDDILFREPILLPNDDVVVHQLIQYIHRTNCHAGTQFVLGKLREKYWIPQGRKTVGKIIRKCVKCRRYISKSSLCDAAPLPKERVDTQFAFQTTGVDLAGPIILKGGKKCWIVLYTCALYRGVYLDIVDSLSSEEFLDSLEKFTCLIGRPNKIYSDNGTNFVGAHNLLKTLNWKKLERQLVVKQIAWTFNPPSAPWWGGWWERLIRMLKELLRRMLGMAKLTRKELELCLASVSSTINNRPLTTLTEDDNDLIPLTPAMFMRDLPVYGLPERERILAKDLQDSYKKMQEIRDALQKRFRKEYLANLIQMKTDKRFVPLEVGDVVLVGADNKKRYEWPLGRIIELMPGIDKKSRVAKVKTLHGIMTRPLQRLYSLEVPRRVDPEIVDSSRTEIEEVVSAGTKTRSGRDVKKPIRYGEWNM